MLYPPRSKNHWDKDNEMDMLSEEQVAEAVRGTRNLEEEKLTQLTDRLEAEFDNEFHIISKKNRPRKSLGMMSNPVYKSQPGQTLDSEPPASKNTSIRERRGFTKAVSTFFSRITGNRTESPSITPTSSNPQDKNPIQQIKEPKQNFRRMSRVLGRSLVNGKQVKKNLQEQEEKENQNSGVNPPEAALDAARKHVKSLVADKAAASSLKDSSGAANSPRAGSPQPGSPY